MTIPGDSPQTFFIDMGWGDWRLAASPQTRVTTDQVRAISALSDVEDMGAAEPRFGEMTGEIIVFHTTGLFTEVAPDGTTGTFAAR